MMKKTQRRRKKKCLKNRNTGLREDKRDEGERRKGEGGRGRGEGKGGGRGERGSTLVSLFFNKKRMTLNTSLEEVVKLNKWILSLCPSVLHRIITVLASNLSLVISLIWILIFII